VDALSPVVEFAASRRYQGSPPTVTATGPDSTVPSMPSKSCATKAAMSSLYCSTGAERKMNGHGITPTAGR
jgi:hypothetical protein